MITLGIYAKIADDLTLSLSSPPESNPELRIYADGGTNPKDAFDRIRAFPDLLEACKGILAWHDKNDPIHTSHFYLEKNMEIIRSAIAKAEGQKEVQHD